MKRAILLILLIPLLFVACGGGEEEAVPETEAPPPPPEPTVGEIKESFMKPLNAVASTLQTGAPMPAEMSAQVMQQLQQVDQQYMGKKNLAQAKSEIADTIEQGLKQVEQLQAWQALLETANILAFFEPNNPNIGPARELAIRELTRPRIGMPDFVVDHQNDVTTVFLSVLFPDRGVTEDFQIREGEDFAAGRFRLLEIIGKNQGIRVLDVKDQKELTIMKREPR